MANGKVVSLRIPPKIEQALNAHCVKKGTALQHFLLTAALAAIGKPELAAEIKPPHRPKTPKGKP